MDVKAYGGYTIWDAMRRAGNSSMRWQNGRITSPQGREVEMCQFLSFAVRPLRDEGDKLTVLLGDSLGSHEGIEGERRECEWTDDTPESLTVRVEDGEDVTAYRCAILAKYATRWYLLRDCGRVTGEVVAGKLHGLWRWLRSDGSVEWEGRYKAGKRHGLWRWLRSDGSVEWERRYKAGVLQD